MSNGTPTSPKPTLRRPGDDPSVMGQIPMRDDAQDFHDAADRLGNAAIVGEDPNDPEYTNHLQTILVGKELAKLNYEKEHPWGSAENHPGTLGKIGHVMGMIGQAAGTALAPEVMGFIPGTYLNRSMRENADIAQLNKGEQLGIEQQEANAKEQANRIAAEKLGQPTAAGIENQELQDYLKKNPGKTAADFVAFKAQVGKTPTPFTTWMQEHPGMGVDDYLAEQEKLRSSNRQPSPFSMWMQQNPGKTVDDYLKEQGKIRAAGRQPNQYADWKAQNPGKTVEDYISETSGARVGAQEKSARDTATVALQAMPDIQKELTALKQRLGPIGGREMEIAAKIGSTDPTYMQLRQNADLIVSALSKVHFGARGSWEWLQDFKRNLDVGALTYPDLEAGLETTQRWLTRYANLGKDIPESEKPPELKSMGTSGGGGAKESAINDILKKAGIKK